MRDIAPYIRLVCEGKETEPNYFNGLLRSLGFKQPEAAFKAKDNSPKVVAKEAKEEYKKAVTLKIPKSKIWVWAVFDRDGHVGVPEAIAMLEGTPVGYAFSNICFEYWILLHYERTTRPFADCDEIISFIRNAHDPDYGKANDHFERLKSKIDKAVDNGDWVKENHWRYDERPIWELNPWTNVQEVILKIRALRQY